MFGNIKRILCRSPEKAMLYKPIFYFEEAIENLFNMYFQILK